MYNDFEYGAIHGEFTHGIFNMNHLEVGQRTEKKWKERNLEKKLEKLK